MFKAIEAERTPQKKTRQIRAFLDSARRAGFYWPALQLMAASTRTLNPAPEIGWFAETAIEMALAAGDFERAREWANSDAQAASPSGGDLRHWLALADIADAKLAGPRGANLDSVERLALTGRFDPVLLHRLATVLDALDTHIPVPLWEAASRTPQPSTGHLPDTGVLSALQEASKKKEFGHTVLLAMKTLGPTGAEGAHMIALGDSIRALETRRLGVRSPRAGPRSPFRHLAARCELVDLRETKPSSDASAVGNRVIMRHVPRRPPPHQRVPRHARRRARRGKEHARRLPPRPRGITADFSPRDRAPSPPPRATISRPICSPPQMI